MQPLNRMARPEERLVSLWERLVTTLGIHTAHVLLDRAIWQTAQRHRDIALIHHDDTGLSFGALEKSEATRPQEEIELALNDLCAEMLRIVARLLGREMVQRLGRGPHTSSMPWTTILCADNDQRTAPAIAGQVNKSPDKGKLEMRKVTVLVVDDDPAIVGFLVDALESEGYRVLATVDGEALPLARDMQPDVILMDIMMPGMDGVEVSQRLREDPMTASIPIVVMSAQNRLRATAGLMQVNDRLAKPFDLSSLYATVARWTAAA